MGKTFLSVNGSLVALRIERTIWLSSDEFSKFLEEFNKARREIPYREDSRGRLLPDTSLKVWEKHYSVGSNDDGYYRSSTIIHWISGRWKPFSSKVLVYSDGSREYFIDGPKNRLLNRYHADSIMDALIDLNEF